MKPLHGLSFLLWLVSLSACSAALDWDEDGLACDKATVNGYTDFCLSGYSCLPQDERCVRDASLKLGESCSQTRQCGANHVCPVDLLAGGGVAGVDGVQQCAKACNAPAGIDPYYSSVGCDTGSTCTPFLDASAVNPNKHLLGACLPSIRCAPGSTCSKQNEASGTCVTASATATACETGCEITWSPSQAYSDNCDSLHTCQPVGMPGAQTFACIYNGKNTTANPLAAVGGQTIQKRGDSCSVLAAPCDKGDVCAPTGMCAEYCLISQNDAFPCPAGQSCCPFNTFATSQKTGYCSASCK
jgi:hypothetical protein